jgi:ABC-type molybdate transport system substrate-binding protein
MKKVIVTLILVAVLGTVIFQLTRGGTRLEVFHAGSLTKPFEGLE